MFDLGSGIEEESAPESLPEDIIANFVVQEDGEGQGQAHEDVDQEGPEQVVEEVPVEVEILAPIEEENLESVEEEEAQCIGN